MANLKDSVLVALSRGLIKHGSEIKGEMWSLSVYWNLIRVIRLQGRVDSSSTLTSNCSEFQ